MTPSRQTNDTAWYRRQSKLAKRSSTSIEAAAVVMFSRRLLTAAARPARPARPLIQTRAYALGSISSTIKGYPAPKDDELRIDHRPDYREPGPLPEELDPDMVRSAFVSEEFKLTGVEWRLHQPSSDQAIKQRSIRRLGRQARAKKLRRTCTRRQ